MKINKWYWIFCFLIIATIFIYGKFRCMYPKYKDILVPQYIKGIDGWSLTHFCTFSVFFLEFKFWLFCYTIFLYF